MVALQSLTLSVWVQILVPLPGLRPAIRNGLPAAFCVAARPGGVTGIPPGWPAAGNPQWVAGCFFVWRPDRRGVTGIPPGWPLSQLRAPPAVSASCTPSCLSFTPPQLSQLRALPSARPFPNKPQKQARRFSAGPVPLSPDFCKPSFRACASFWVLGPLPGLCVFLGPWPLTGPVRLFGLSSRFTGPLGPLPLYSLYSSVPLAAAFR